MKRTFSLALASGALLLMSSCESEPDVTPANDQAAQSGTITILNDGAASQEGALNERVDIKDDKNGPNSTARWLNRSGPRDYDNRFVYTGTGKDYGCDISSVGIFYPDGVGTYDPAIYAGYGGRDYGYSQETFNAGLTIFNVGLIRLDVRPTPHLNGNCAVGEFEPDFSARLTLKKRGKNGKYFTVDFDTDNWNAQGEFLSRDYLFGDTTIERLKNGFCGVNLPREKGHYRCIATVDRENEPPRKLQVDFFFEP